MNATTDDAVLDVVQHGELVEHLVQLLDENAMEKVFIDGVGDCTVRLDSEHRQVGSSTSRLHYTVLGPAGEQRRFTVRIEVSDR